MKLYPIFCWLITWVSDFYLTVQFQFTVVTTEETKFSIVIIVIFVVAILPSKVHIQEKCKNELIDNKMNKTEYLRTQFNLNFNYSFLLVNYSFRLKIYIYGISSLLRDLIVEKKKVKIFFLDLQIWHIPFVLTKSTFLTYKQKLPLKRGRLQLKVTDFYFSFSFPESKINEF